MDRPHHYRSAEDVVPRDAACVIVCGSVKVVPPRAFAGYQHLARVVFEEGVQVIRNCAFAYCPRLTTVDCRASSLRTIDDEAFCRCCRLLEVMLREGLQRIGKWAFNLCCALERIAVPSSVVEIGDCAFNGCRRLSEVNLKEGLRKIGSRAFQHCALERIAVPSSVVQIGYSAFEGCRRLSEVTLAGGMVTVAHEAFIDCPRLERVAIPSMAVVVEARKDGSRRVVAVTGGTEWDLANHYPRLILASPHLASMRPEELTNLTDAVDQIAATTRGAGRLVDGDVSARIRECFVDRLSTWYGSYKNEAAAILELALWKIELGRAAGEREAAGGDAPTRDDCRRSWIFEYFVDRLSTWYRWYKREAATIPELGRAMEGGEEAGGNAPTRDDCRINCGANPIVGLVLSSLAGPHRRADQGENAGSIQP